MGKPGAAVEQYRTMCAVLFPLTIVEFTVVTILKRIM